MRFSQAMRQLGRAVAYYPELAKPLGGVTAAVLFCQLFYWQDKTDNPLGVYKTLDDLMAETGLTERELRSAREKLRELAVVVETNKRLEHKLYFRVDFEVFDALMASFGEASERHSANSQNVSPRNDKTSFGEASKCHSVNTLDYIHKNTTQDISPLNPPEGSEGENEPETVIAENLRTQNLASAKNTQPNTKLADNFHAFWQAGLPKLNRTKAEQAFKRAFEAWRKNEKNRGQGLVEFTEMLIADIRKRNGLGQFGFDKLHPTTYLNGKRWEDDYPQPSATPQNGVSPNAVHSVGWSARIFTDPFSEGF